MSEPPFVTVLIPARDEEADIERCLDAVLAQDHPHDGMEIVLVDGGSTDGTAAVARRVLEPGDIAWRIVENRAGTTPSNLNAGLAVATGDVLCRVDARSIVPAEYVRLCAELLESRPEVAVTGGAQHALTTDDSARGVGIARALNNRYTMGGSRYRSGAASGPSDTVYLGAFRTRQVRAVGGWDERLPTNQDYELNRRLSADGLVWFDARLEVGYVPRTTLAALWKQYHRFGRWKVRYWREFGDRPQHRQTVRLIAPAAAGLTVSVWIGRSVRPRRLIASTGAGVAALLVIDSLGARSCNPSLGARGVAIAATAVVSTGWVSGAYSELLIGRSDGGVRAPRSNVLHLGTR